MCIYLGTLVELRTADDVAINNKQGVLMSCSWWGAGYGYGWHWANHFFWIIVLLGIAFLIYRSFRNNRQSGGSAGAINGLGYAAPVCPQCKMPVEEAYLRCPECHFQLKTNCPSCAKIVKTSWDICPYCEGQLSNTKKEQ